MKKLKERDFKGIVASFSFWYLANCSKPPFYDLSDDCLSFYKDLLEFVNQYNADFENSNLSKIEKKTLLIIQAYLLHYNQYLIYKENDLIDEVADGYFIFKKDLSDDILDLLLDNIEKGIKKIERAKKMSANDEFSSEYFRRTYRLLYNDKANYYDFIEDYDKEEEILNYILDCEKNNIIKFTITTRVNLVKLLLKNDNPNMDLINKYNDEILDSNFEELFAEHKAMISDFIDNYYKNDNPNMDLINKDNDEALNSNNEKLFSEHKAMISILIYNYYKNNCEYEKALDVCNLFKDKTDKDLVDDEEKNNILNLIEERNRANVDNDNKLSTYFEEQIISKMSNDVKIMLNTSINMYDNYIKDKNNMSDIIDYSIVNISALKAVEGILYEIVGVQYLGYLHTLNNLNLNGIPNGLKDKDNQGNFVLRNSVEFLEYGDAIRAMGKYVNEHYVVKNTFKNFCVDKHITDEKINRIPEFLSNLFDLKEKRNTNAHKNRIDYNYASECKELLFDSFKIVEKLYDIFDNLL